MLDEATSNLDIENERYVTTNLQSLGITQIIVAHRPETIARAHRVVDIRELCGKEESTIVRLSVARPARA